MAELQERSRGAVSVKRALIGRPRASGEMGETLLSKKLALPVFASDPLSSVAYATEAALVVLVAASVTGAHLVLPISMAIAALLGYGAGGVLEPFGDLLVERRTRGDGVELEHTGPVVLLVLRLRVRADRASEAAPFPRRRAQMHECEHALTVGRGASRMAQDLLSEPHEKLKRRIGSRRRAR